MLRKSQEYTWIHRKSQNLFVWSNFEATVNLKILHKQFWGLGSEPCNVKKKVRVLSESTLCECHCIKELLARNRCDTHLFFMRIKYFCLMIKTHDKIQVRFLSVHLFLFFSDLYQYGKVLPLQNFAGIEVRRNSRIGYSHEFLLTLFLLFSFLCICYCHWLLLQVIC